MHNSLGPVATGGIAAGMVVGAVIGVVVENAAIGIGVGLAIGIAFGGIGIAQNDPGTREERRGRVTAPDQDDPSAP